MEEEDVDDDDEGHLRRTEGRGIPGGLYSHANREPTQNEADQVRNLNLIHYNFHIIIKCSSISGVCSFKNNTIGEIPSCWDRMPQTWPQC